MPTLRSAFPDHIKVFKRHFVRDLTEAARLPAHHRRQLRRAERSVGVEMCARPLDHLDEWMDLYSGLVDRHAIRGISGFSRESFRQQLAMPEMLTLRAVRGSVTVAMALWLTSSEHAYYHLGASSPAGYEVSASYALFAAALEHLRQQGTRCVDLGGVAGAESAEDGLSRFKRGWANSVLPAYLCGRIFDPRTYAQLSAAVGPATDWFPAYRATRARIPASVGD
jgi:lipid II:glycine glycyltransferase (peptidoglycan interpeptide bridge formation enzyme)